MPCIIKKIQGMSLDTYNKQFEHEGYTFNIKVELNNFAERRPGGARGHQITINDMGQSSNFYRQIAANTETLEMRIATLVQEAIDFVDGKNGIKKDQDPVVLLLERLGFTQ
jgi:hypothetical protein